MKLNKIMLLSVLIVGSLLFAGCTSATSGGSSGNTVLNNIVTFQWAQDIGISSVGADPLEGFVRILMFILLFAVLFKLTELLKLGKNISMVVSFVVSLITVIFIPSTVLIAAAASWGTMFSVIILGVPILLGFWAYFFMKDHIWIRVVIMGVLWWVMGQGETHLGNISTGVSPGAMAAAFTTVNKLVGVVTWIVIIFFFVSLIQAFTSLSSGHDGENLDGKETAKHWWNKLLSKRRRTKTASMNQYIEDEKELKEIDETSHYSENAITFIKNILGKGTIDNVQEKNKLVVSVNDVGKGLYEAKKHFARVTSKTKTQQRAIDNSLTQLKKIKTEMKDKEKDIDQLKIFEKTILEKHKEAQDNINEAVKKNAEIQRLNGRINSLPNNLLPPTATGPYAITSAYSGSTLKAILEDMEKKLAELNVSLSQAETVQKEVITNMQGAMLEARELFKWK